ncbi:hypothetical protein LTR37_017229 [Vermiconidia calcicola]|uniref:Uncharacterized protein n=1 Tax=Vermiconidia calcicola TaxID=1690605 RepID=A0ACC3MN99_9PEZI|nr:hypothetical protein LTR37_017229 [Vermiconidia calcicola]
MADRRGILVPLVILAFIFLSPDPVRQNPNQFNHRPSFEDVIAEEQRSLSELQNSTYNERVFTDKNAALLNLTGLEPDRGYSWDPLPQVQDKARKWLGYAGVEDVDKALELEISDAPLYRNVTGSVHGSWVRSKLEGEIAAPNVNLTEYTPPGPFGPMVPRAFRRNITGEGGDVRLRFHEKPTSQDTTVNLDPTDGTRMDVEMTISDELTGNEYDLRLLGTYIPSIGQAMLTTTSDKFAGIFMLPHMAMSQRIFEASRGVLNESISNTIQRQIDGELERRNPWSPTLEGATESPYSMPECEYVVYLQQLAPDLPITKSRSAVLSFLESELRFPTGAFIPRAPALRFAMTAFSPDCGFVIESKGPPDYVPQEGEHLTGPKVEVLYNSSRNHLLLFTLALGLQLFLLMRQMREASTPSTRSRISFYTIAMLSLGDGFTTMAFLLTSIFINGLWVNLVSTAFLAFVSVSFFGMRFLMDIWAVQAPERIARARAEAEEERRREEAFQNAIQRLRELREARIAAAAETTTTTGENRDTSGNERTDTEQAPTTTDAPQDPATIAPANATPQPPAVQPPPESLPLPVTAQRPTDTGATPVFMTSDQEGLEPVAQPNTAATGAPPVALQVQSFGSLYTRFYLLLLGSLFVSLNAASWPASARRLYFTSLAFAYLSFWLPQLKRNVQRNCRHALNWEFIIGQSGLRLIPFAYFYGYKHNVLFAEVDYTSLALLALWVWIQILLLASQEFVGPRWFIRQDWAPPAYDYHPILREDEEGATMPIGFSQAAAESSSAPTSPVLDRTSESGRRPSVTSKRRDSTAIKETKDKGKRIFDCAICMQDLEVPVIESGSSSEGNVNGPAGLLARRAYMVTPCRHIFHSACLEGWMKYRLQCPICRETLPPL